MSGASDTEPMLRDRAVLALDVDDLVAAMRLARLLKPYFSVAKVGLELFSASGPEAVEALIGEDYRVFVDLKLYDIPTTVAKAARVIGSLGASYLTLHLQGGAPMIRAGVEGLAEGALNAGSPTAGVLGVTVLTSEASAPLEVIQSLASAAAEGGCKGVVCAVSDVGSVRSVAPGLMAVVAGIRSFGMGSDDQARPATLALALEAGADLMVVGRAVTAQADPLAAAAEIFGYASSDAI